MKMTKPETQEFSSERLNRINPVLQRYVDEKKIAGIVSLIARHGEIVHFEKTDIGIFGPGGFGNVFWGIP